MCSPLREEENRSQASLGFHTLKQVLCSFLLAVILVVPVVSSLPFLRQNLSEGNSLPDLRELTSKDKEMC